MTDTILCVLTHGRDANGEQIPQQADCGYLCTAHRRKLDRTVREIRELWIDLQFIVEAGSAPKDETPKTRHLKSAEAPAPANLEVLALRDARSAQTPIEPNPAVRFHEGDTSTPIPSVLAIVASWVQLVAEERPLTAKLPGSVVAQLALLGRHHDWMAQQPWIDDYVTELGELRKALAAALRDHTHREIGRCRLPMESRDVCGGPLLEENGSDTIKCGECGARWSTPQERARLALTLESA